MTRTGDGENASELAKRLREASGVDVSHDTIRYTLKKAGLRAVRKPRKPRLTKVHKEARLNFAKKYKDWTDADWERVIFSDETSIRCFGNQGRKWIYKTRGAPFLEHQIEGTVKYGGKSLMFWGCMTAEGVGYGCRIKGTMNAELYTSILSDELVKTIEYFNLRKNRTWFQQDNDPKHTSLLEHQQLETNSIRILDWPSQSPDLNPIEHLWAHLKRKLAIHREAPKDVEELWERVEAEWNNIPTDICQNLVKSMRNHIQALLKAKGGHIKY